MDAKEKKNTPISNSEEVSLFHHSHYSHFPLLSIVYLHHFPFCNFIRIDLVSWFSCIKPTEVVSWLISMVFLLQQYFHIFMLGFMHAGCCFWFNTWNRSKCFWTNSCNRHCSNTGKSFQCCFKGYQSKSERWRGWKIKSIWVTMNFVYNFSCMFIDYLPVFIYTILRLIASLSSSSVFFLSIMNA